jgi:hypothetical protein
MQLCITEEDLRVQWLPQTKTRMTSGTSHGSEDPVKGRKALLLRNPDSIKKEIIAQSLPRGYTSLVLPLLCFPHTPASVGLISSEFSNNILSLRAVH